ncbi:transcription activator acu-15 [Fusarium acutatum]|uniref:Transcription activator acu-15 n=1 Tax=Fusarium acutatum TaxID=78861 RepID=A0A8H4JQR2_9HYPO|nr:transcription activator acu-15 [Fusarium acutatum]
MLLYCPGLTKSLLPGRSTPAIAATAAAAALPRLPISGRYFQRRPLPSAEFRRHKIISAPGPVASHPTLPLPGTHPPSSALTPGSASTSPASISHRLPSASASTTSRHPTGDYLPDADDQDASTPVDGEEPPKKKQKRNKPTLSCHECVERKTKVRHFYPMHFLMLCRAVCISSLLISTHVPPYEMSPLYPDIMAHVTEADLIVLPLGIKRQTECRYAHVANLLEETTRSAANGRRMTKPPKKKSGSSGKSPIPNIADRGMSNDPRATSRGAVALSIGLLSNVPYSLPSASNVFGIGSEHPFANYWTCEGGLPEVISVLPDKIQADILLSRYFECVDPVYPMIHRQTFYADYEHFWQMNQQEKTDTDPSFIALIFVMLALGTQFVTSTTSPQERRQTAEFYASASNQALRIASYLSSASLRSIQAMVLLVYFLINDNHASDGWAFAGILIRQAYAMGLHRDPNIVTPNATLFEKQQRRKVWQAVLLQDTFLTVLLSLPPSATHTDVSVEDLLDDGSSIANSDPTDTAYIRGSWTLANLVQETICSPRSLDLPICTTARHKSKLIADFRAVYRSFPDVFRSWDPDSITALAKTNKRVVRQTLFLTSNYFHNLMLVHASESPDVPVNVRGTLEAAHDAITAFFLLFTLLEIEARVWWVFNHRAFLEALCIGNVLKEAAREPGGADMMARDPLLVRAKADITRMIQIMQVMGEDSEVARTRVQVLSDFLV